MTTPSVPVSAQAQRDEIRDTAHGGPLWEPLSATRRSAASPWPRSSRCCWRTVFYSISVLDLKIVKGGERRSRGGPGECQLSCCRHDPSWPDRGGARSGVNAQELTVTVGPPM
jgi:hypothetical protein